MPNDNERNGKGVSNFCEKDGFEKEDAEGGNNVQYAEH